ncbi:RagB/SusD family nutrient uptake outer membrane protein [Carboxylicivirga linearis]|uniref:RagB/SusD family nutrient uptake outer membrane protein n=1 Tax=Carboxylicivirga linearis TaxID=1628157 RepID=A0ABS5JYI8_9BACT|nr:RagB/SusD family nutrient uptake outer membrane protein [Carboxylicivirga linearis]MBS2099371.1 RagB/SusD family nutrient uptake outer membrane protein [Carboxylicivirga linearis]
MKRFSIYIMALSALLFSSCSDFLDSEPITEITEENFYRTKADAEQAIVGCYDGVQALYAYGIAFPVLSEVVSDNCFGGVGNTDGYNYQVLDEFDINTSAGEVDILNDTWIGYYKAIYRMNMLLSKMEQIDWEGDEEYKTNIEAQARFLRAYCYFDMVRLWERVPLLTEPMSGNIPQSPADSTYKVIAEDLKYVAEYGSDIVEAGRVNQYAGKALLGRVFLFYTGYYEKDNLVGVVDKDYVLAGLEDVVGNSSYGLVDEYKNLWPAASSEVNEAGDGLETTYAGKDNMETIFAIKYNITSDYNGNTDGNHWLVMLGLRDASSTLYPPYGQGWGACTVLPELFTSYAEGDLRRDASIISINGEGLEFDNGGQREFTGYTNKKYTPMASPYVDDDGSIQVGQLPVIHGGTNFMIGQFQDYVVMRYADVLLMAAELGSANADNYLNQVRSRAGLTAVSATQSNIMRERRYEFAFEGIRYWDLLRQGVNTAADVISIDTKVQNGGVETSKVILESKIVECKGLQQIPQYQITRSSGVLTQNAGW